MAKIKIPKSVKGALPEGKIRLGDLDYDPRFDKRAKEQERIKNTEAVIEPRTNIDAPTVSLVDYEGYPFVTSMSDRSRAGGVLTQLEGVNLNRPVDLLGGQDYMFENPGQVWASGAHPVRQIMAQAAALKQATGLDPLYMPWRMAPTGGDFASMAGETMLNFAEANMSKGAKKRLDKQMKAFIPDWAGVDSDKSIDQFRAASDTTRKNIKNMLDVDFRNEGGVNIGQARLATTDPRQANAPDSQIMNVGRIFADKPIVQDSGHVWYPRGVPGEGLGVIDQPRSIFELLPDYAKERGIPDPSNPRQTDIRSMQMKPYGGIITDKLLKSLGMRDGGMVDQALTGMVQTPSAKAMLEMDLARLAMAKEQTVKKADGGEVKKMAGGGLFDPDQDPLRDQFSVYAKPNLSKSPVIEARKQSPAQEAIGTVGGWLDRAGKFITESIEPIAEKNPVKTGLVDFLIADPLRSAGTALQDWTGTSRDITEDNPYAPSPIYGGKTLQTFKFDPRTLDVAGFAFPAARGTVKAVTKGVDEFGVPLAEKALTMIEKGQDPFSAMNTRLTGMQGNPAFTDIFAGSKSKTADLAMRDLAEARLNAGEDPALVWKETGWGRPPYGGDMRYEISDEGMSVGKIPETIKKKVDNQLTKLHDLHSAYAIKEGLIQGKTMDDILANWSLKQPPTEQGIKMGSDNTGINAIASKYNKLAKQSAETYAKVSGKLGSYVDHPELFAAYPDFANIIKFETAGKRSDPKVAGEFSPHDKKLSLNLNVAYGDDAKSVMAHELSHGVQNREGTSPGGSPEGIRAAPHLFDPFVAQKFKAMQDRIVNDTGRLGELHKKRENERLSYSEREELDQLTRALPEYTDYHQERDNYLMSDTPNRLYRKLAGEAEARLTQGRLGLNDEERRSQYPWAPEYFKEKTGYEVNEITNNPVRSGSSISSMSDQPSVAQMKAELQSKKLAPADNLGFYSPAESAALNIQRKSGSGQAFLNDLKKSGVKDDEIEWTGLGDFLRDKKDVSANEVKDYIAKNRVSIRESRYGSPEDIQAENQRIADKYGYEADFDYGEVTFRDPVSGEGFSYFDLPKQMQRDIDNAKFKGTSKYDEYALPGGENYREILLKLPPQGRGKDYYSKHYDEPNVLAHMRVQDFTDAEGKKMMLIDEIQSDWHQAGRDRGYNIEPTKEELNKIAEYERKSASGELTMDDRAQWADLIKKRDDRVFDAPFKDNWHELAIKQAIKQAADKGYDRVGLVTGARQNERYDLSKQIDQISYYKNSDGTYDLTVRPAGSTRDTMVLGGRDLAELTEKQLEELVGKDVAKKIVGDKGAANEGSRFKSLTGLDLQVGGKGMKTYYDEIYPSFLKKFAKKHNASFGETTLPQAEGEPVRYLEITPSMREAVKKGLPYKNGGAVDKPSKMRHNSHNLTAKQPSIDTMRLALQKRG